MPLHIVLHFRNRIKYSTESLANMQGNIHEEANQCFLSSESFNQSTRRRLTATELRLQKNTFVLLLYMLYVYLPHQCSLTFISSPFTLTYNNRLCRREFFFSSFHMKYISVHSSAAVGRLHFNLMLQITDLHCTD